MSDPCVSRMIWGNKTALHGCPHPSNPSRITFRTRSCACVCHWRVQGCKFNKLRLQTWKHAAAAALFFLIKAASWSNEIRWNPASLKSIKQEGGWSVGNDVQMLSLLWIFLRGRKARMCGCVDVCVLQDVTPAWLKRFAYIGKRCAERLLGNRADWSKTEGCYIALVTLQHGWKLLGMASK